MDQHQNSPSFLEFFAGGGMVRAGMGRFWRCLFANDIDEKKAESYRANFGAQDPVFQPLSSRCLYMRP
jgi:DNA (cytosine-5)-methyltransferase 1